MQNKVVIRTDASVTIGAGHFMRQLALAQLLIDEGISVHLLTKTTQRSLLEQAENEEIQLEIMDESTSVLDDARYTVNLAKKISANWVILDGYSFETDYQKIIKAAQLKLMCVDDLAKCHFVADLVLNQNTEDASIYSKEPYTQLLMGPRYALLRREFREYNNKKTIKEEVTDIMITMGGADESNITGKILGLIVDIPEISHVNFHIVIGALNPHRDLIKRKLEKEKIKGVLYSSLSSNEMIRLMEKVDLAITAGGSTIWEYMKIGVIFIYTRLVENQNLTKEFFEKNNLHERNFYISEKQSFKRVLRKSIEQSSKNSKNIDYLASLISNKIANISRKVKNL